MAEKADNESRFVIIDGVQISRERAIKRGLLKAKTPKTGDPVDGPPESRARTSSSARRGGAGGTKSTIVGGVPVDEPAGDTPAGDGTPPAAE